MKTLTIFTPTYNRAHTLPRVYDSLCQQTSDDFEWLVIDDGSTDNTRQLVEQWQKEAAFKINYIYKENGGLYTGYNTAYLTIQTELNVCIDSDDFMPPTAVERIVTLWQGRDRSKEYAGITGLDFYAGTDTPIGGFYPEGLTEGYFLDLYIKKIHHGDSKQVMRTDLMRSVAPQVGFPGEKDFNPVYMLVQVMDRLPIMLVNENFCFVEYQQTDSMSANIYRQYMRSPRSFAKSRIMEMQMQRSTLKNCWRSAIHYVAECIIARDSRWLSQSPRKMMTLCAVPFGVALYALIRWKTRNLA